MENIFSIVLLIHFCRTAYSQESCDVFIFSSLMVQSSQKQGFWPFIANLFLMPMTVSLCPSKYKQWLCQTNHFQSYDFVEV